ncbi:HAMP domain-containing protein [Oscillatoriales cyanobacterium LEGE 11467]|uniref:HAMP domain-containing protein n=1 Tax=Zarconia navalis LEGE 11467 TaxID=1828826 RepID=A0A928Z7D1_9CYAN|nr:adenylate/guanylate cyclase domain-containing protein [Zarconia navalis]MBE9040420.1 HAMP domain-containing protein [Zarconia navalis LEGE 11467]
MKKRLDSITTCILFPFLTLIGTSFAFSIIISVLDSQRIIDRTFEELSNEINNRVKDKLTTYFSIPHLINQINSNAIELNNLQLDSQNSKQSQTYFAKQLISFRNDFSDFDRIINAIYYATPNDEFWSAEYNFGEGRIVSLLLKQNEAYREMYGVDRESGEILNLLVNNRAKYTPSERPWFIAGSSGKAWSDIYQDSSTTNKRLVITAVKRIVSQNFETGNTQFEGVLGVDLLLSEVEDFLEKVIQDINNKGLIFITQKEPDTSQSNLIVTSHRHDVENRRSITADDSRTFNLVTASNLFDKYQGKNNDTLLESAKVISYIAEEFDLKYQGNCRSTQTLEIVIDNEIYLVKVSGLDIGKTTRNEAEALNWCIFWTVPESELLGNINSDKKQVSWQIYAVMGIFLTGVAVIISYRIVKPIKILTSSVRSLSTSISNLSEEFTPPPDITRPSELSLLSKHFNTMSQDLKVAFSELRQKTEELEVQKNELTNLNGRLERTNEAFRRFIPQNFSDLLGRKTVDIQLGDSIRRRMTIFFSDIRSFTSLSDDMQTPKENFDFINGYLKRMEGAIAEHHGFIDKYIGDAIMALFDDEDEKREYQSARNAIEAGLSMLEKLVEYNKERQLLELQPIYIGIGIHLGDLRLGTVGGQNRMDTTVISPAVNLTSRLEGLTKHFGAQILISENVFRRMSRPQRERYAYRYLGLVKPKGIRDMVGVYEICDGNSTEVKACKMVNKEKFEDAIALYIKRQFSQASLIFQEILEACPSDKAAKFYLDCCENERNFSEEFGK